jgi:hypothetical protein
MVALACLVALPAAAQLGEERHNLAIGVNGGVNMASVSFSPQIKQGTLNGTVGGLTIRYMSEKYFKMMCGLQMEINYSQRGWNEKIEDGSGDTYSRTMNYIEVPLLAHLAFGKDSRTRGLKFFVNLGPEISYFLNDKETMSESWNPINRPNNVTGQYGKQVEKKMDYGITAGGGFELSTGIGHFLVEGRYYLGLSDFYNNTKKDYFGRSAHSLVGIKAAYLIDITK